MDSKSYEDFTVIIPTLNEEENIDKLLDILDKLYPKINVIVSDDGSKDQTQQKVNEFTKKNPQFILHDRSQENIKGLTASIVDARSLVKTPFIIVIDGDLQHPPEKIEEIADSIKSGADICVGTREKDLSGWHIHRRIISKTAVLLGQSRLFVHGIKCKDPVSGFFGIKTGLFKTIDEKEYELSGYKVLFDTLKKVPPSTKVDKVFYFFGLRKTGKSKINKTHMWVYFRSLFK